MLPPVQGTCLVFLFSCHAMLPRAALSLLILLPALSSCGKKGVGPLPEATQTGQNSMGCLLDGTPWLLYWNAAKPGTPRLPMVAYFLSSVC